MYQVGVVGPELSVTRIIDVAKAYEKDITFKPFVYKQAIETKVIVQKYKSQVDAWLFSGPIPYTIAKNILGEDESLHGILFLETGFYKSLVSLLHQKKGAYKQISIDLPEEANIFEEAVKQLEVPIENLRVKTFPADAKEDDIFEYHYKLWEKGDSDGILTCYPGIKEKMEKIGIPVSWMTTTRMETRQTLQALTEKAKAQYYQMTQMAVCFIDVETPDPERIQEELLYDMQWADLKIEETLLHVSRQLHGSLQRAGNGKYMIFCSRGDVNHHINLLQETIKKLKTEWKRLVSAGVGFGESVLKAEANARRAVSRSKAYRDDMIVLLGEHGEVKEYRNEQTCVSYSSESAEPELVQELGKYKISFQLYSKIRGYGEQKFGGTFTSRDIAIEMSMSSRNSQRVLQGLKKAGLVQEVGETKSHDKGRPMKLYSFFR